MSNKEYILGASIIAVTGTVIGWGISKFQKRAEENKAKDDKYEEMLRKESDPFFDPSATIAYEEEEVVQEELPLEEDLNFADKEFIKFKASIGNDSRDIFNEHYGHLGDIMCEDDISYIGASAVSTLFITSVVARNKLNGHYFTSEVVRNHLEGNAALLSGAIKEAMGKFDEESVEDAINSGRLAMDVIIEGVSRKEYMYKQCY